MWAGGHNYSSPDVLALLNQAPPETLDQLVRGGYLPNNSSSSSLQGMATSNALRDSQGWLLPQMMLLLHRALADTQQKCAKPASADQVPASWLTLCLVLLPALALRRR